ncbi:MAG: hypothetical protein QOI81_1327 [Actinomycetota bacterium]|jgi:hypothetical protein|nr:hypothetical protein [Actinomycetota bacterium]
MAVVASACYSGSASAPPARGGDPLIVAVGDIACDPANPSFAAGRGTTNNCQQAATSDLAVGADPTAVLALGDLQYDCGGAAAFAASYGPTWGRLDAIVHPVPGNQEYNTSGTDCPAAGTAAGYFGFFGASAGTPGQGWYSFDLGSWHIIALNANCDSVGGCHNGSPQETWLAADLKAHPSTCTLAFWHQPRFSSGSHNNDGQMDDVWKALYAAHADVVLNGHDHLYERFAPQDPNQHADPNGITEFIVGTGGDDHGSFDSSIEPNSQVRNATSFGVLEMTLHPNGYDWRFVSTPGGTFSDQGSGTCH